MATKADKIQVEGIITRVSSLADGGLSIGFHTNELNAEEKVIVMKKHGKFGYVIFSENVLQPQDIPKHDAEFEGKTPSQRLRAVIFVLYAELKKAGKTTMRFEDFYAGQIENLIAQYKSRISTEKLVR